VAEIYNLIIPTEYNGTARYSEVINLSGENFVLHFDWNSRDDHWYLSVNDSDDLPISGMVGRKLTARYPVGARSIDERRPPFLIYVDTSTLADPTLNSLGLDDVLLYLEVPGA